ncbi:hypothetical protein Tco_1347172 [Tanacetum coccineum]
MFFLSTGITDTICRWFLVSTSFTQGKVSSIPIGSSISLEGFLSFMLLLVVIIVMVVIVAVILVVVVIVIVGVVIIVVFIGIVVVAYAFHQDKASSVRVPVENVTLSFSAHLLRENTDSFPVFATGVPVGPVFLLGLLSLVIDAACAFRAEEMPSLISFRISAKVMAGVLAVDVLLEGILST